MGQVSSCHEIGQEIVQYAWWLSWSGNAEKDGAISDVSLVCGTAHFNHHP